MSAMLDDLERSDSDGQSLITQTRQVSRSTWRWRLIVPVGALLVCCTVARGLITVSRAAKSTAGRDGHRKAANSLDLTLRFKTQQLAPDGTLPCNLTAGYGPCICDEAADLMCFSGERCGENRSECREVNSTVCAEDGQMCECNGFVKFGTDMPKEQRWTQWMQVNGSICCSRSSFPDVWYLTKKECQCHEVEELPEYLAMSFQQAQPAAAAMPKRVAVLMAGTLVRYFPNLDTGVVRPLVAKNHSVDVYLSLSVEKFKSWREEADGFQSSPLFWDKNISEVKQFIADGIAANGGRVGAIKMPSRVELTPAGSEFVENGSWWTKNAVTGNTLGEFNRDHARTTRANVLKLFRELKGLWDLAREAEEWSGQNYTHVMIFRDDSNWIGEFDIDLLLATGGDLKLAGERGRVYTILCDPWMSKFGCKPNLPRVNDYVILAERQVAQPFADFYTMIAEPADLGYELDANDFLESELYVHAVAKAAGVRLEQVPAALFPFQRSGRLLVNGSLVTCLHKRCDSSFNCIEPLDPKSFLEWDCSDLKQIPEERVQPEFTDISARE